MAGAAKAGRGLVAIIVAVGASGAGGTAAAHAVAAGPLTFAEPRGPVVRVPLATPEDGRRHGRLSVIVRNRSRAGGTLRIRYFPTREGGVKTLNRPPRCPAGEADEKCHERVRLVSARRPIRIGGRDFRQVRLAFSLSPGSRVSAIDGRLVVELRARRTRRQIGVAVLRLRGVVELPRSVSFSPRRMTIAVARRPSPFFAHASSDSATVTLRGDGAGAVLDAVRPSGVIAYGVLNDDEGRSVTVRLRDPERVDGVVTATVEATDISGPGSYTGELRLGAGHDGAPALATTVNVRSSFWLALAAVFLGALTSAALPFVPTTSGKRRALRRRLEERIRAYEAQMDISGGAAAGYDLEALRKIGRRPWHTDRVTVGGIAELIRGIDRAGTQAELATLEETVDDKIRTIDRWLAVERVADQIERQLHGMRPIDAARFADTKLCRHARRLLNDAGKLRQANDQQVHALVNELDEHTATMAMFRRAWELYGKLGTRKLSDDQHAELERVDPRSIDAQIDLDSEDRRRVCDGVDTELSDALRVLERIDAEVAQAVGGRPTFEGRREIPLPARMRSIHKGIDADARKRQPSRLTDLSRRARVIPLYVRGRDTFWLLVPVVVGSATYALTLYHGDAWGTTPDFVTAFTAGFGSKVVLDAGVRDGQAGLRRLAARAARRGRGGSAKAS